MEVAGLHNSFDFSSKTKKCHVDKVKKKNKIKKKNN